MSTTAKHEGVTLQFEDGGEVKRHGQIIGYIDPAEGDDEGLFHVEPGWIQFDGGLEASLDEAIDHLLDCWRRQNLGLF